MKSRLYQGEVTHYRQEPGHGFNYPVWYAWINLDEIDEFCSLSHCLSREKFNLLSFYRQDYLPGETSLKESVQGAIAEHTQDEFTGQIYLLTTLRQLGCAMNPISLYYCYETAAQPRYVVVEVHNTPWGERHTYVLDLNNSQSPLQEKEFHVSPFMPMDLAYRFKLPAPGSRLEVGIHLLKGELPIFNASLDLQALPASSKTLRRLLLTHGWQSLKTLTRIYYQAMRLGMKKAIFYSHPKHQRDKVRA